MLAAIALIETRRAAQHLGTANANLNTHMPSYSVNANVAESAPTNAGSAFGGMQTIAFQSKSKAANNATASATRSIYNNRFNDDTGPSKVLFSSSTPNEVIPYRP